MIGIKNEFTGKRFGRLVVLEDSGKRDSSNNVYWLCRCDCGNEKVIMGNNLKKGATKSCGCYRKEHMRKNRKDPTKHGDNKIGKKSRLYSIWIDMKNRCYGINQHSYKWYGGKNIIICDEWKYNYATFKKWALTNGYQDNLTIDRINSDGNYKPSNCQWIPRSENTRKSHAGIKHNSKGGRHV